jgi:hypothetical protein
MGAPAVTPVDPNGFTISPGGSNATPIPVNTVANTVIKATSGRLCRVIVTVTGAAAMSIYDNAAAATGTIIGQLPANPAVGSVYDFQTPAALGITVGGAGTNPGVTITYL